MDDSSMTKDGEAPTLVTNNKQVAAKLNETESGPNDDNGAEHKPKDPESLASSKDIDDDYSTGNGIVKTPFHLFLMDARLIFKKDEIGGEILRIALPAALALAADPIASLIDTAFIGHIGPVELAAVGVSIAIFNQVSRIAIFPLVSITTSFVAEEDAICEKISSEAKESLNMPKPNLPPPANAEANDATATPIAAAAGQVEISSTSSSSSSSGGENNSKLEKVGRRRRGGKRHIPSVSTALVFGALLGLVQAIGLIFGAKFCLHIMGVRYNSPMFPAAHRYLTLRSLGAPAVLLSLAMQGVFRGFKDTKTPLYATVVGDVMNIILDPILIFACRMGVSGAAIAHVVSQYLISLILFLRLMQKVVVIPPSVKDLQFGRFLKNGSLLLGRVVAVTFCVTLAASLAARKGSIPMAAFQICLQIWLTTSLLADGLAVAAQAMLASAFAKGDKKKVVFTTSRVLQLSLVLGFGLAVFLGVGLQFGWRIFTKNMQVKHLMLIGIPFVAATQPINSLAFVLDGVNFGASDFAYTAYSMVIVSVISTGSLFLLSSSNGFVGIWIALTIYMSLRTFASFGRIGTATGPWMFLRR